MSKYAVVVCATGDLLPGVNALLNGLKYYGNEVDFHLIYSRDHIMVPYVQAIQDSGLFPNFFPVIFQDYIVEVEEKEGKFAKDAPFYLMTLRYYYASGLRDYDAVVVFDADEAVVNNIMWFLEVAAKTDFVIAPNNGFSGEEYDAYDPKGHMSTAGCCIYNHPFFFSPAVYGDLFRQVPQVAYDLGIGDINAVHELLKTNGLMSTKVFVQPGVLWITIFVGTAVTAHYPGGKRFLQISTGDRLRTIHGRWWYAFNMEKFSVEPKTDAERLQNWTIRYLWETYYFLNHLEGDQYYSLDTEWDVENWGEPSMWDSIGSGKRW